MNSRRLKLFEERLAYTPYAPMDLGEHGQAIVIHHLSDDDGLPEKVVRGSLVSADAYWRYRGDIHFMSVMCKGSGFSREQGLWVNRISNETYLYRLYYSDARYLEVSRPMMKRAFAMAVDAVSYPHVGDGPMLWGPP